MRKEVKPMNIQDDYLHISLQKNQNEIAVHFANFFKIHELESMDLREITYPEKSDIEKSFTVFYDKIFPNSDRRIQLIDIILVKNGSADRYMDIRMFRGKAIQMDIKCKYDEEMMNHLLIIWAKAINFEKYKDAYDKNINQNHVLNNFAIRIVALDNSMHSVDDSKYIINYVTTNKEVLINDNFDKQFIVNNCIYAMQVYSKEILRISVSNAITKNIEYMYIRRDNIGLSNITIILEKALRYKDTGAV